MKKKDQNILLLIGAGVAIWWFLRKNKKAPMATPGAAISPGLRSQVIEAQSEAAEMANDIITNTTFVPDFTTDADRYAADKNACR